MRFQKTLLPVQQNSEELLVKKVVGMQCQDGGWTMMGTTGDSDMTGMAMQALASYYNKDGYEDVTAAIDKGLAWIERISFPVVVLAR